MHSKQFGIAYSGKRLYHWCNLFVFTLVLSMGCTTCYQEPQWTIEWKDGKAASIDMNYNWVGRIDKDSITQVIRFVSAEDPAKTPILGTYTLKDRSFLFEPLIPFTRGMSYEVYAHDKKIGTFNIGFETGPLPVVKAIYPGVDTVPENLLKTYIEFSQPMSEGRSKDCISITNEKGDTLRDVFLDLQPELWNENRTVLTLWLDPGRIKRDLQPNLKLGTLLRANHKYKITVSARWPAAQGRSMEKDFSRTLVTTARNETSPDPSQWKLVLPAAASADPVWISFDKPLDHFLLGDALYIRHASGEWIKGKITAVNKDRGARFTPAQAWVAGNYNLMIASKLEDLCGNNINRPFDRDMTKTKTPSQQEYHTIPFTIK